MTGTIEQIDEIIDRFAKQGIIPSEDDLVTHVVVTYKPVFYNVDFKDSRNIKFIKKEDERMTDDFLTERSKGFTVNTYNDVPLIADTNFRDLNNRVLRRQAIWAVRHPNKKMPTTMAWAREWTLSWLVQQKIEFTPIVENPDPTQLERLGVPTEGLKKAIMDAVEGME